MRNLFARRSIGEFVGILVIQSLLVPTLRKPDGKVMKMHSVMWVTYVKQLSLVML